MVAVLASGGGVVGKGRLPVIEGMYVRLAHGLPGELAEGQDLHRPFGKNNH